MIKKTLITLFIIMFFCNLSAQSKNDMDYVFKTQLFLNKHNVFVDRTDPFIIKGDSLFNIFKELTIIKINTLNLDSDIYICDENFLFYSVKESQITYTRNLSKLEVNYFGISSDFSLGDYIISVNQKTGSIYKLSGFDTNDFLSFLADYKEIYLNCNSKNLKTSTFLKKYKVSGLDFDCIYKGLKAEKLDRKKHPCLYRCNDAIRFY